MNNLFICQHLGNVFLKVIVLGIFFLLKLCQGDIKVLMVIVNY